LTVKQKKTLNRFPKLYYSSLHARLISDYLNPAIVDRPKLGGTGIRHHQVTGIMPVSESGHRNTAGCRNTASRQNPATTGNRAECRQTKFRQNMAGIRSWTETGRIRPKRHESGLI
jgi:hypothetical protein